MKEFPTARTAFLASMIPGPSDSDPKTPLLLKDRKGAAITRDRLAAQLNPSDEPQVLVLDLEGVTFTPSGLQELILPLAQRIKGGEFGAIRLLISTTDQSVSDFIRYMAQVHQLPLYLSESPFDLKESMPAGALTTTERSTLDIIVAMGGQVTASKLAVSEGIAPSAAVNRLVNLDREGYVFRLQRGRRKGDLYFEPRSATSSPMVFEEPFAITDSGTSPGRPFSATPRADLDVDTHTSAVTPLELLLQDPEGI